VLGADGEKLSKQNGALALDLSDPLAALGQAAQVLGLPAQPAPHNFLTQAQASWARLFLSRTS
jgi:glutamyl-Q tRNA(Asp) synthetase